MKKFSFSVIALIFVSLHPLNSQEMPDDTFIAEETAEETEPADEIPEISPEDAIDAQFVITTFEFDIIKGRTRPYALMYNGEFQAGVILKNKEELEKYIQDKTQLLLNQRVLEEVFIEYFIDEQASLTEGQPIPVTLLIHVTGTGNIIVLPYPKYDSNEGFSITLKARDYNFFGTMSALRVDFGYQYDEEEKHVVNFLIDSDIPFLAAGLIWRINFDHSIKYTYKEPFYYQNITGLSVELPWRSTLFNVGFDQYLTVNEENSDENIEIYGLADYTYGAYATTELFGSWKIPTGVIVGNFGELIYTPKITGKINYHKQKMEEPLRPVTSFNHTIGFSRVDWIGNFQKGLDASITNGYNWYLDRTDAPVKISLDGTAAFYWPFNKYIGIYTRLKYRHWWHWSDKNSGWIPYYFAGDVIRGVVNKDIRANNMLSLNLDIPVRVLRFWPSEWFNNPKLRFFNFEMFFSPFTDLALWSGPYSKLKSSRNPTAEKTRFNFKDMISTVGLEIIVFPGFFRSFYLRGSLGYDIKKIKRDGLPLKWGFFPKWNEVFIGVDLHY